MVCRAVGAVKLDFTASLLGPMGPFLAPLFLILGELFCLPPIFSFRVYFWPSSNSDCHHGLPLDYIFPLSYLNLSVFFPPPLLLTSYINPILAF
jgi:hypothetical protein